MDDRCVTILRSRWLRFKNPAARYWTKNLQTGSDISLVGASFRLFWREAAEILAKENISRRCGYSTAQIFDPRLIIASVKDGRLLALMAVAHLRSSWRDHHPVTEACPFCI